MDNTHKPFYSTGFLSGLGVGKDDQAMEPVTLSPWPTAFI